MNNKKLALITIIWLIILAAGFFVVQSQSKPYALIMQSCGGVFVFTGDHITWHGSIDEAKQQAESRFGQNGYNLASIAQSPSSGMYSDLLWLKTTSASCYDGQFMEWTSNP